MPRDKDLKRLIRARMAKTGESYTAARAHIVTSTKSQPLPLPDDYEKVAGMSDAAVKKASRRTWPEWAAALDRDGAAGMEHRAIAELVRDRYGVGDWWAQSITVGYERLRGLRDVGQRRGGGYDASKSVTLAAPVETLWHYVHDPELRERWLPGVKVEIRTATEPKSMRIRLADGEKLEAYFTAKGPEKSALALQVRDLPDREAAQAAKELWGTRLQALKALVAAG